MRVMTVVGTRPEIIRLSRTIALLEETTEHYLVHTGQNYDHELNQIFLDEFQIGHPYKYLDVDTSSLGSVYGGILKKIESVLLEIQPDAFLVLGDTNSAVSALMAKRLKIPVYHMEAGNRSFDANVPEEVNRKLVDHIADFNLAYTESARRNLLAEGIEPRRITVTGSPMYEVIQHNLPNIEKSEAVSDLGLDIGRYFLVSVHREENVDNRSRLAGIVKSLKEVGEKYGMPVVVSTHPRTRKRLEALGELPPNISFLKPFGFFDYMALQMSAYCVLSDSGTISEESTICQFPAVTLRDAIERPEALETGNIITSGIHTDNIIASIELTRKLRLSSQPQGPLEYKVDDCSKRAVAFIHSTYHVHHQWSGIRTNHNL